MSWSMLHSGDMSSKVFENFTTYGKKKSIVSTVCTHKSGDSKTNKHQSALGPHRRVNVLQEEHGAALTLQQGQCSLHDLSHDLLQVGLLLKKVVDHL